MIGERNETEQGRLVRSSGENSSEESAWLQANFPLVLEAAPVRSPLPPGRYKCLAGCVTLGGRKLPGTGGDSKM
jgi:hypothetical protein